MKKTINQRNSMEAVSPVIAVMLMLVVTIIIAAVVSAFAGGLASEQKKTPTMTIDVTIENTGSSPLSKMDFIVRSVSEPIPTKDIKIITSWKAKDGTTGGAIVLPWSPGAIPNTHHGGYGSFYSSASYHSPVGYGPNINWTLHRRSALPRSNQNFGNFTLEPGVGMSTIAFSAIGGYGYSPSNSWDRNYFFKYTDGTNWNSTSDTDGMIAVLGKGWEHLREGDIVNVRFIHIPTGGTILEKNVPVILYVVGSSGVTDQ